MTRFASMLFACLTLSPTIALADRTCDALWFTRNMIFDRAGYCFGSALGQAMFTAECSTTDPVLTPAEKAQVDQILQFEADMECAVDTSQTTLDVADTQVLTFLDDLPTPEYGEWACMGWLGPLTMLRAGRSETAETTGFIQPGDDLLFWHIDVDGWSYVSMTGIGQGLGWFQPPVFDDAACRQYAG